MKSSFGGFFLYSVAAANKSLKILTTLVPSAAETKLKGIYKSSMNLYDLFTALGSKSILFATHRQGICGVCYRISPYQFFRLS